MVGMGQKQIWGQGVVLVELSASQRTQLKIRTQLVCSKPEEETPGIILPEMAVAGESLLFMLLHTLLLGRFQLSPAQAALAVKPAPSISVAPHLT
jgi:hypothetical protein